MAVKGHRLIGEILVDQGFVTLPQVNEARRQQMAQPNVLLGEYLVELGYVTPEQLLEALSRQAEDFASGAPLPNAEGLPRGLPARAFELYQLVSLPQFQAIADQMKYGFYVVAWAEEGVSDRLLFVNTRLASWFGMDPLAFRGKATATVVSFGSRFFENHEYLRNLNDVFNAHPTEPLKVTVELVKPKRVTLRVNSFPLKNKAGEKIGTAGFLKLA